MNPHRVPCWDLRVGRKRVVVASRLRQLRAEPTILLLSWQIVTVMMIEKIPYIHSITSHRLSDSNSWDRTSFCFTASVLSIRHPEHPQGENHTTAQLTALLRGATVHGHRGHGPTAENRITQVP